MARKHAASRAGADLAKALDPLARSCEGYVALRLSSVPAAMTGRLTERERAVYQTLGPQRGRAFLASRAALKRLARALSLVPRNRADRAIETLADDGLPTVEAPAADGLTFSVSHDDTIVVAVYARGAVGVDVERISPRLFRAAPRFVFADEAARLQTACDPALGSPEVLARIWTLKEACGKALGLPLLVALREVRVESVGASKSTAKAVGRSLTGRHAQFKDHVFTVVVV